MYKLEKIKLLPARERVGSALRKAIISGEFKSGEVLVLEDIADRLGVSITPVREAFQMLDAEGLIELSHNKGAIVQGMSREDISDHYELRGILESAAIRLACERSKKLDDLIEIHNSSLEAKSKGDINKYSDLNQSFHMEIWELSKNKKLVSTLSNLWNGLSASNAISESQYAEISFSEHENILNAMIKGNVNLAEELMRNHISRSEKTMTNHY